jgi:ribosomal protein S18 acetylase RimI-like enzyme
MLTRDVMPDDAPKLQSLMRDAPQQSNGVEFSLRTEPDFFGRARAYDHARVLVAEEDGELAGSAAIAIREQIVDGRPSRVGYEFQYFTASTHRRRGVASHLRGALEQVLAEHRVDYTSAVVVSENHASIGMFEKQGFERHRDLEIIFLLVLDDFPHYADPTVRPASPADLPAIADLVNATWHNHDLRTPVTAESLARSISRVPTLRYERLLVKEDRAGRIVASAAIWDWSAVQRMHIHRVDPEIQALMPTLRPNSDVRNWGLTHVGYASPHALLDLVRFICGEAKAAGVDQVGLVSEPETGIAAALPGIPKATIAGAVLLKTLNGRRPTGDSPVYVDVIDL